jgi:uncharacterized membrane protein
MYLIIIFPIMKYVLYIIGFILVLVAINGLMKYASDYSVLTDFGKGYIWGNVILLGVGAGILVFAFIRYSGQQKSK